MSPTTMKFLAACVLLATCTVLTTHAHARAGLLLAPMASVDKGPYGIGNPPKAQFVGVDVSCTGCPAGCTFIVECWEVPNGMAPLISTTTTFSAPGTAFSQQFGRYTSGSKVEVKTYVVDMNNKVITPVATSATFTVP